MSVTLDQIVEATRELPSETVVELVGRILVARHGEIDPGAAAALKSEIERRLAGMEYESEKGASLEDSLALARQIAAL